MLSRLCSDMPSSHAWLQWRDINPCGYTLRGSSTDHAIASSSSAHIYSSHHYYRQRLLPFAIRVGHEHGLDGGAGMADAGESELDELPAGGCDPLPEWKRNTS